MADRKIPATYIGLCLALLGPAGLAFLSKTFLPDRPTLVESIIAQLVLVLVCASVLAIIIFWERQTLSSIGIKPFVLRSVAAKKGV